MRTEVPQPDGSVRLYAGWTDGGGPWRPHRPCRAVLADVERGHRDNEEYRAGPARLLADDAARAGREAEVHRLILLRATHIETGDSGQALMLAPDGNAFSVRRPQKRG